MAIDVNTKGRLESKTWILNGIAIAGGVLGILQSPEPWAALKSGGWAFFAVTVANLFVREFTTKGIEGWLPKN